MRTNLSPQQIEQYQDQGFLVVEDITPRTRKTMTCAYMPEDSAFNGKRNILPDSVFSSLRKGDVLADDGHKVASRELLKF